MKLVSIKSIMSISTVKINGESEDYYIMPIDFVSFASNQKDTIKSSKFEKKT